MGEVVCRKCNAIYSHLPYHAGKLTKCKRCSTPLFCDSCALWDNVEQ